MMILAAFTRSVYALAIGWVVSGLAYACLSYLGHNVRWNRFEWDREAAQSILHFGRWTAGSSTLTIMQLQGDRMVLGKLLDAAQLGVYSIGANLALPALSLFNQISGEVAMPTYAKIRELPADAVRSKIRRLRRGIVVATLLSVLALTVLVCQPLVDFCYPPEYRQAGWYCSLVAIGMMLQVSTDLGPIFLAHGNARMHFFIMLLRTVAMAAAIAVGYFVGRSLGQPAVGAVRDRVLSAAVLPDSSRLLPPPACLDPGSRSAGYCRRVGHVSGPLDMLLNPLRPVWKRETDVQRSYGRAHRGRPAPCSLRGGTSGLY